MGRGTGASRRRRASRVAGATRVRSAHGVGEAEARAAAAGLALIHVEERARGTRGGAAAQDESGSFDERERDQAGCSGESRILMNRSVDFRRRCPMVLLFAARAASPCTRTRPRASRRASPTCSRADARGARRAGVGGPQRARLGAFDGRAGGATASRSSRAGRRTIPPSCSRTGTSTRARCSTARGCASRSASTRDADGRRAACFPLPVGLGASFGARLVRDVARVKALRRRDRRRPRPRPGEPVRRPRFGGCRRRSRRTRVSAISAAPRSRASGRARPRADGRLPRRRGLARSGARGLRRVGRRRAGSRGRRGAVGAHAARRLFPWRALVRGRARRDARAPARVRRAVPRSAYVGQTLLRDELGFEGLSVSDCSDVGALVQWRVAATTPRRPRSAWPTVDQDNQCGDNATWAYLELADAGGRAASTRPRSTASRACWHKFSLRLFDGPFAGARALANLSLPASRAARARGARRTSCCSRTPTARSRSRSAGGPRAPAARRSTLAIIGPNGCGAPPRSAAAGYADMSDDAAASAARARR